MSITTVAGFLASNRQVLRLWGFGGATQVSNTWHCFNAQNNGAGYPGQYSAIGNTANGVVPTDATSGFPAIDDFSGSGYITSVEFSSDTTCNLMLVDRLFHAGAFAATVGTNSLTSQPSFSSRIPGGTDYNGIVIMVENANAGNGSSTYHATYTDQSGNSGHSTPVTTKLGTTLGSTMILPLASGDSGVSVLESFVVDSQSSGPTYNVSLARILWRGRCLPANVSARHFIDQTGMPQVWSDSCLAMYMQIDSNSSSNPLNIDVEIASA